MLGSLNDLYLTLSLGKNDIETALTAYKDLDLSINYTGGSDSFFNKYGVGNYVDGVSQPYERLKAYEFLLSRLSQANPQKFASLHKGTAYFFCAWFAFDMNDFVKAMYYLLAAIHEDKRAGADWKNLPMGKFLRLIPEGSAASRTAKRIQGALRIVCDDYCKFAMAGSVGDISPEKIVDHFISPLLDNSVGSEAFELATSLYHFVLEHEILDDVVGTNAQLEINTQLVGDHFFRGGRLFESCLRVGVQKNTGQNYQVCTLKKLLNKPHIKQRYGYDLSLYSDESLDFFSRLLVSELDNNFYVAWKVRNKFGHGVREHRTLDLTAYRNIFNHLMFSILRVIEKEFLPVVSINS